MVRPKLSCAACKRIVQEPAPSRPIDRGLAGPGLLALVLDVELGDADGILSASVECTPIYHATNGIISAVARCCMAGFCQ